MKTFLTAIALPALLFVAAPLSAQDAKYVPANAELKAGIVNKLPQPQYPAALRNKEQRPSGNATLRVYVGAQGTLDNVKLIKSSGSPELDQHAQEFARKSFKFSPYKVGATPTAWMFDYTARYKAPAAAAPGAAPTPSSSAAGSAPSSRPSTSGGYGGRP